MSSFTIIQIFRDLGFEPHKRDTWTAGALLRDRYEEIVGSPPPKELRTKTSGGGSHCFAIYPEQMRSEAEKIVRMMATEKAKQMDMFA